MKAAVALFRMPRTRLIKNCGRVLGFVKIMEKREKQTMLENILLGIHVEIPVGQFVETDMGTFLY